MNIWLIMSGEPLEHYNERPHRIGILSKMLVAQGHDVMWWTTAYDHQHKKYFFNKDTELLSKTDVNMFFLYPSLSYKKNISFERIINYKQVSLKFREIAKTKERPDIILCAFPSIDLAYEAVKYGKKNDVPVVVDVRDMWPDIFLDIVPQFMQPIMYMFLLPLYSATKYVFENAYSITAMTDEFIEYGLKYGKREKSKLEQAFPFAYPKFELNKEIESKALDKFKSKGINFDKFIICYFGTIGKQFNFEPVIKAAHELQNKDVQFIICGVGDNLENLKNSTKELTNFILPGWLDQGEIWTLMKYSKAGLAPYVNKKDFLISIPNKIIEYLAGGLPIISNIDGVLGRLIDKNGNGFIYNESSEKLINGIIELKSNENMQKEMSEVSKKVYETSFEADVVYSNMINYLEEVLETYRRKNENIS